MSLNIDCHKHTQLYEAALNSIFCSLLHHTQFASIRETTTFG